MWKAHFGAVDGAIACRLEHGEDVMITRVEDDSLGGRLCREAFLVSYCATGKDAASSYLEAFESTSARHRASAMYSEGREYRRESKAVRFPSFHTTTSLNWRECQSRLKMPLNCGTSSGGRRAHGG